MIKYSSRSEKGLVRENNEDSLLSIEIGEYLVLAVADGLGGVQGGEIASKIEHSNYKNRRLVFR